VARYCIVEVSSHLRQVQAKKLELFKDKVMWSDRTARKVLRQLVLGNEAILDADACEVDQARKRGVV
jgi:SAM-dependent MidA family methyltransferase